MRAWLCLLPLLACCKGTAPPVTAESWPEADALFHSDPRWLGADGAYSVDLGGDRTLWLFGDTFLAREPGGSAANAYFLRNTVAIQTGRDPSRAFMAFYWSVDDTGGPQSFVPQDGSDWFWPGGGARIGDTLVLFYGRVQTPPGDPSGFEGVDWRVLVVDDPDDEPSAWTMRDATLPADHGDIYPGTAILLQDDYLYSYAEKSDPFHDVYLARWPVASAGQGDFSAPEWWCGSEWSTTCGSPAVVVSLGAPELSVQADGHLAPLVMVQTEGVGAATMALRTAPAPEGPWSGPESFFRPPESEEGDTDVYAGKAHPGLTGADIVATYVPASLYFPRFVKVSYR